jgi:hypothetical protein
VIAITLHSIKVLIIAPAMIAIKVQSRQDLWSLMNVASLSSKRREAKGIAAALMMVDLRIMSHKADLKFNWARAVQRSVC